MIQSIGFSPAAATRTRICPGPACGAGTSRTLRTSGPPNDSSRTALLVLEGRWSPWLGMFGLTPLTREDRPETDHAPFHGTVPEADHAPFCPLRRARDSRAVWIGCVRSERA